MEALIRHSADRRRKWTRDQALETATIAAVMTSAASAELDRLERLTLEEEAIHSGSDDSAKQRLSGNFHVELARAAGNAVIEEMLRNVLARLSLVAALYERDDDRPSEHPCRRAVWRPRSRSRRDVASPR